MHCVQGKGAPAASAAAAAKGELGTCRTWALCASPAAATPACNSWQAASASASACACARTKGQQHSWRASSASAVQTGQASQCEAAVHAQQGKGTSPKDSHPVPACPEACRAAIAHNGTLLTCRERISSLGGGGGTRAFMLLADARASSSCPCSARTCATRPTGAPTRVQVGGYGRCKKDPCSSRTERHERLERRGLGNRAAAAAAQLTAPGSRRRAKAR